MAKTVVRWLGHAFFQITSASGKVIVIDPWIEGNPSCPVTVQDVDRADIVAVTHNHFDHVGPPFYKEELLKLGDHRISEEGVITIKAQQHRTQERNREDALERLSLLIHSVAIPKQKRKPTKPTKGSQNRRIEGKKRQGRLKQLRGTIE